MQHHFEFVQFSKLTKYNIIHWEKKSNFQHFHLLLLKSTMWRTLCTNILFHIKKSQTNIFIQKQMTIIHKQVITNKCELYVNLQSWVLWESIKDGGDSINPGQFECFHPPLILPSVSCFRQEVYKHLRVSISSFPSFYYISTLNWLF